MWGVCACGGQKTDEPFLNHSPLWVLKQGLSLGPAAGQLGGILLSPLPGY